MEYCRSHSSLNTGNWSNIFFASWVWRTQAILGGFRFHVTQLLTERKGNAGGMAPKCSYQTRSKHYLVLSIALLCFHGYSISFSTKLSLDIMYTKSISIPVATAVIYVTVTRPVAHTDESWAGRIMVHKVRRRMSNIIRIATILAHIHMQ